MAQVRPGPNPNALSLAELAWYATCEGCQSPLSRRSVRWRLTQSPNADYLVRPGVTLGPYKWDILCLACFTAPIPKAPYENNSHRMGAVQAGVSGNETKQVRVASNSSPGKFYNVSINFTTGRMECDCPWGMYHSNQDQGQTVKWCSHIVSYLQSDSLNQS